MDELIKTLTTCAASAVVSGIVGTIIGFWVKKRVIAKLEKRDADARELEERRAKERTEELKKSLMVAVREELKPTNDKIDGLANTVEHIKHGTLSSLRNDILTCYYKCCEKGYRNDYDYKNIHELDEAYLELEGNSFIADIIKRFDELPTKEKVKKGKDKD